MVTDQQVILLRRRIMEGKTQQASAATAGMSARSARRWQRGPLPSEKKKRSWRTRPDAFSEVWEEEIVPLLRRDAREKLQATVLLEWLDERYPGRFNASHLRTLQRRLRDWRALNGPDRATCGYEELEQWSRNLGQVHAFGIEGTGSYGAGLARFLTSRNYTVVEINRPDRSVRRRKGKSDATDAEMAARAVLSGIADAIPKSGEGEVEVYFEQEHPPGREAQMDFTHCDSLEVTIGGEPFEHMLFEFILSHSGWRYAQVCFSETFAALVSGLQGALWELGAVPEVVRSDNLGAATHDLKDGRDFNGRYKAILDHYGLKATRTNSYSAHENGVAEQGHRRLKDAVAQELILRGSADFESVEQYAKFVRGIVDKRNRLVREKVASEYPHLRALPPAPVPEYVSYSSRVRKWSTIRVDSRTYSVPSRLIGVMVDVRLYTDHVEVYYKGRLVESMERIRGKRGARIDYRHIIGSLVRKPGAFARYRFREQMYPTHTFRLAYDAMCGWKGERADVDYVRIFCT